MHVDMSEGAMRRLIELVDGMRYDLCVLTGDYRGKTFGPFAATLEGVARVRAHLKEPVYGVLGDHDTVQMVPGLEAMGIRMLLNECTVIVRGAQQIYLAGIDDAHFFRVDNIEKAALQIPYGEFSILLSHTPEIYRQAAHADFNLLLSGHTHGGQICLPGSIPIILDYCLDVWGRELGSITTCLATLPWVPVRASFLCASTVRRKSPCIAFGAADRKLIWFIAHVDLV
jgi:predicted MPP superfamily phosphohydrolase